MQVFIALHKQQVVTCPVTGLPLLLKNEQWLLESTPQFFIGSDQSNDFHIVHLNTLDHVSFSYSLQPLRQLLGSISEPLWSMIGRGAQLVEWYQSNRFCSRCGHETALHATERAVECSYCHYVTYPRISPCVMVLIRRNSQVLLAQSSRHHAQHYSLIAGFVEAGESVEAAAHREVLEEVGLIIQNLQFICSQPWPFPDSLMLGFTADYVSGDIHIAVDELADAQWFTAEQLNQLALPQQGTLSHKLIEYWRNSQST